MAHRNVVETSVIGKLFGRKPTTQAQPETKVAYCIPRNVLHFALFDEDGPFSDLPITEKYAVAEEIEDRLHSIGWRVEASAQALNLKDNEYHRRLARISKRGGIWAKQIRSMIDLAYDYLVYKDRTGSTLPYPWPFREISVSDLAEEVKHV